MCLSVYSTAFQHNFCPLLAAKTLIMLQRFEQQMSLKTVAISDVKFPLKSRKEDVNYLKRYMYRLKKVL